MQPSQNSKQFDLIQSELFHLAFDWQQYREMFENEKLVDLMQQTAPAFFDQVRLNLVDVLSLRICRLLDPPTHGRFENLGFKYLIDEFGKAGIIKQIDLMKWNDSLEQLHEDAAPINHFRNKELGHNDATTMLKGDAIRAEASALKLAIDAMFRFFNGLVNVGGPPLKIVGFNDAILAPENVNALERVLGEATELRLFIENIGYIRWLELQTALRAEVIS